MGKLKIQLKELRCPGCNKLLGKSNDEAEITCTKCKVKRYFNPKQSADIQVKN